MVASYMMERDSFAFRSWKGLENQLAFWDMQQNAVETGCRAAEFLGELLAHTPGLRDVRVHTMGHSFGGLVVVNLAQHLVHDGRLASTGARLQTVGSIQGAYWTNWFEKEEKLISGVKGCVASVYSRYDSANGFYYPFANQARRAAGFVGHMPWKYKSVSPPLPATFATSPNLDALAELKPADDAVFLNLDASQIVYEGSVGSGGGHGDIFKDDVVHLLWAITRFRSKDS